MPDTARSVHAAADLKNLQQLVYLRWTAVFGQVVTIEAAYLALGLALPYREMLAIQQAMFEFGDGSVMVNAIIVAQRSALPTTPVAYAISGGTGAYAGAAGIAEYVPGNGVAADRWRFTFFGRTDKATPVSIKPATQVEARFTQVNASGTAKGGIGDLVLAGGWWRSGKAERDHILVPEFLAPSSCETQEVGVSTRLARDVLHQYVERFVIGHELAAVDMAVAITMLQRNLPLPARTVCRRAGIGQGAAAIFALTGQRHGAVTRQVMGPIFIAGFQGLLDQQSAKAGAVDE